MIIREIQITDCEGFTGLAKQLGYDADPEYVKNRIAAKDERETVFIAEENGAVTGWIDCKIQYSFLVEPFCEIEGLIVDERMRSRHVGAALLAGAEAWAAERHMKTVVVRSNVVRERAHQFYLRNGYENVKQSKIFKKTLAGL